MKPNEYFSLIKEIFSQQGLTIGSLKIQCSDEVVVKIESYESGLKVVFTENKPKITFEKFISLSALLKVIYFSDKGGVLELINFPDIPFVYNDIVK